MKTREEIEAMPDDDRRIRTAELCGWKWHKPFKRRAEKNVLAGPKKGSVTVWRDGTLGGGAGALPDYLNSLDAMHEAEKELGGHQLPDYAGHLRDVVSHERKPLTQIAHGSFAHISATPRQRNCAFLMTLL